MQGRQSPPAGGETLADTRGAGGVVARAHDVRGHQHSRVHSFEGGNRRGWRPVEHARTGESRPAACGDVGNEEGNGPDGQRQLVPAGK